MADDTFEVRDKVAAFATYEDYLDSQITELDMFYLEDEELARFVVSTTVRACTRHVRASSFRRDSSNDVCLHRRALLRLGLLHAGNSSSLATAGAATR